MSIEGLGSRICAFDHCCCETKHPILYFCLEIIFIHLHCTCKDESGNVILVHSVDISNTLMDRKKYLVMYLQYFLSNISFTKNIERNLKLTFVYR